MEIIPVIDLMGGKVVRAQGGQRDQYLPLVSTVTSSVLLEQVVADLLAFYPFKTLYIADLDSIAGHELDMASYQRLVSHYPEVNFWLDSGIKNKSDWREIDELGVLPIIASESLIELSLLEEMREGIVSLDFQGDEFIGDSRLWQQTKLWPQRVIAMSLANVGMAIGPNMVLIEQIKLKKPQMSVIAAGGIRMIQDIELLVDAGVKQALVGSAIYDGKLRREDIEKLSH